MGAGSAGAATIIARVVGKLLIGAMKMADIIFGFVVMVICAGAVAFFMFLTATCFSAILEMKQQIADAEHIAEVKSEEALEKLLRGYEVEGRTMEEWFALIKKQEAEHGTERVDTGTLDGRSDV